MRTIAPSYGRSTASTSLSTSSTVNWITQIVQGNFGISLRNNEPVLGTILRRLPLTAELALLSVLLSAVVAVPLGVISAVKQNSAD